MNKDAIKYIATTAYHKVMPKIATALIGASVLGCLIGFFYLLGTYADIRLIAGYFLMVIIGSFLSYAAGHLVKTIWKDWTKGL